MNTDQVIDPVLWQRIQDSISRLLSHRAELQTHSDRLWAAGCVNGNIVEEWRNTTTDKPASGPYYRLTYYTDPETGQKPRPKYLGKNQDRVNEVRQQIANYEERQQGRRQIEEIDRVLASVTGRIEGLDHYLRFESGQIKQLDLVMPASMEPGAGNTKQEATSGT